jgi:hypothetical protein
MFDKVEANNLVAVKAHAEADYPDAPEFDDKIRTSLNAYIQTIRHSTASQQCYEQTIAVSATTDLFI